MSVGGDLVVYLDNNMLWRADGTPEGTRPIIGGYQRDVIVGPLPYVFSSIGWNYYNAENDTVGGLGNNVLQIIISSSTKNYGYRQEGFKSEETGIFLSFNPTTKEIKEERRDRTYNGPFEPIVYKDELVLRRDLYAAVGIPLKSYKTNPYVAPHLGYIYFSFNHPAKGAGFELWRTDLNNSKMVADVNAGAGSSNPRYYCDVPGKGLFFFANPTKNTTKISLYLTNGNSGYKTMGRFETTSVIPIVRVKNRAVFIIRDASNGLTLWATNGTAAGTIPLMAVTSDEVVSNTKLAFFSAKSQTYGIELYMTDGTVAGTKRVPYETRRGAGNTSPRQMSITPEGNVVFIADTPEKRLQVFKYIPPSV